jgi:uncharacterized membrane protein YfcA
MTTFAIALVVFCALLTGFAKGGFGGMVIFVVPILSLGMPTHQAVAIGLPLLLVADVFGMWTYWRKWEARYVWLMLPFGIVGTVVGAYALTAIGGVALRRLIGVMTLLYVGYRSSATVISRLDYDPPPNVGRVAGFFAGLVSAMASAGTVPYVVYMLPKKQAPVAFAATFTLYFFFLNWIKLPFYVQTQLLEWGQLRELLWVLPFIVPGVWAGRKFIAWVDVVRFEQFVLVVLALTGVLLLLAN